jgi:hypothetical protein
MQTMRGAASAGGGCGNSATAVRVGRTAVVAGVDEKAYVELSDARGRSIGICGSTSASAEVRLELLRERPRSRELREEWTGARW